MNLTASLLKRFFHSDGNVRPLIPDFLEIGVDILNPIHIRKKRWHILIGPSLRCADKAVRYVCRYTKRPVIAEGRIVKFERGYVM